MTSEWDPWLFSMRRRIGEHNYTVRLPLQGVCRPQHRQWQDTPYINAFQTGPDGAAIFLLGGLPNTLRESVTWRKRKKNDNMRVRETVPGSWSLSFLWARGWETGESAVI